MTGRVVRAPRWALLGKPTGGKEDYRILHGTPGLGHDRAWSGVPSTPQLGGRPGPGRLPWVTFTPHLADGHHWMAITVIDATNVRDSVGRPVVSIRYAELPFTELARDGARYLALYQAVPSVTAMRAADPNGPLALDIEGTGSLAEDVFAADAAAFDRAAGVAALLLGGEVLIVLGGSDLVTLEARLQEFDQILALLPFGLRASATLASWHDGTQPTAFRLAFGEFAFRGQTVIGRTGQVPMPDDRAAVAYLEALLRQREVYGTTRVLEHLGGYRWPQERPVGATDVMTPAEEAREIPGELADPGLILSAVRDGRASPGRVAAARELAADRFDAATSDELESYLLAQGGSVAGQSVLSGWSRRTAALAATVVLEELARLAEGEQSPAAWRLRAYAAGNGADDQFLAALAEGRTGPGAEVPPERIAACLDGNPPGARELPLLRETVLSRPALARVLLHRALNTDQGPEGWLGWLNPLAEDAPVWLRRYSVLFGPRNAALPLPAPGASADDESEDLALIAWFGGRTWWLSRLADEWWPHLFTLARPRLVAPGSRDAGPSGSGSPPADRASGILVDLVRALLPEPVREIRKGAPRSRWTLSHVRSDTLGLYCGLPPARYPIRARAADALAYLDALWDVWSSPPAVGDAEILTARLLTGIFRGSQEFLRDASRRGSALVLLRAVIDDRPPLSDIVADAIARVLLTAPYLYTDPGLTEAWWASVERRRPDVRTPIIRLRAAVADPKADPADVAFFIGRAAGRGSDHAQIAEIAGGWVARYRPAEQRAIFRIIQGVVQLADDRSRGTAEDLQDLAALLGLPKERITPRFLGGTRRSD